MAQLPPPFDSDPQQFEAAVTMTRELLDAGKIRLKASPAANLSYNVTAADLRPAAEKHNIPIPIARSILNEISAIASLFLRGRVERFIDEIVERPLPESGARLSKEEQPRVRFALLEKVQRVENQLLTDRVRQKFHATRASKHETLVRIRWEVTERKYDRDEAEKAGGPIALMRFEVASRSEIEIFPIFFGIDESQRRSFLIECDEDDLDDLIETLKEARDKLAQERSR